MTLRHIFAMAFIIANLLTASGQIAIKTKVNHSTIDFQGIDYIEIRNHSGQKDTIQTIRKRLTAEQSKIFVEKWNSAKSKGPCKYIVLYWVDITLNDKTVRTFRVNGQSIKENNDQCFDLGDGKYIDRLWKETK